jgi:hypothetical protein
MGFGFLEGFLSSMFLLLHYIKVRWEIGRKKKSHLLRTGMHELG